METKPSWYTTEWWVTVFTIILSVVNWAGAWDFVSNWHQGIIVTIVMAAYKVSRGLAKSNSTVDPGNVNNFTLIPRRPKHR